MAVICTITCLMFIVSGTYHLSLNCRTTTTPYNHTFTSFVNSSFSDSGTVVLQCCRCFARLLTSGRPVAKRLTGCPCNPCVRTTYTHYREFYSWCRERSEIVLNKFEKKSNSCTMGLLTLGEPLAWEETKQLTDHVRQHGIDQFLNLYHQLLDRKGDVLKWGDEVNTVNHFVLRSISLAVLSRSST